MARSLSLFGLFVTLLVAADVVFADVQAPDLNDLKTQVAELAKQVKDAEDGKFAAQQLLEEGRTKQLSYTNEIQKLQESLADKHTQESTLQGQLVLLQEEVKKLKADGSLHKDLAKRFEGVSSELKATKDKLEATLSQLADSSTSATASQQSVQDATDKLEAAHKERDEALAKLKELEKSSQEAAKLQKDLEKGKAQTTKLQGEIDSLKAESKTLKGELADSKAKASEAASAVAGWKAKAEKAEKQVESAEKTLEKALQDHTNTQSALIQAEAKAEEAVRKMEALLTSWLPHWLEQRYHQLLQAVDPAVKQVQPVLDTAWKHGKAVTHQSSKHAITIYGLTKAKCLSFWQEAKPTLLRWLASTKKQAAALSETTAKVAGPHFKDARKRLAKAYIASSENYWKFLESNPTIIRIRRSGKQTLKELEDLAILYLKKVPALKPYAQRPTVTYLVWAALAAPIVTIFVPLIALGGGKKKGSKKSAPAQGAERPAKGGSKAKKASGS